MLTLIYIREFCQRAVLETAMTFENCFLICWEEYHSECCSSSSFLNRISSFRKCSFCKIMFSLCFFFFFFKWGFILKNRNSIFSISEIKIHIIYISCASKKKGIKNQNLSKKHHFCVAEINNLEENVKF